MDFDWANEFAPPWFTRPRRGRGRSRCQCSARLHRNLRDPSEIMNPFAFWTGVWGEAGLRESGSFAGLAPFGLHLLRERVLRVWTSTGRMNSPLNGSLDPGGVADLSPGCLHPGNRSARLRPTPEGSRTFPVPMPRTFAPQPTRTFRGHEPVRLPDWGLGSSPRKRVFLRRKEVSCAAGMPPLRALKSEGRHSCRTGWVQTRSATGAFF